MEREGLFRELSTQTVPPSYNTGIKTRCKQREEALFLFDESSNGGGHIRGGYNHAASGQINRPHERTHATHSTTYHVIMNRRPCACTLDHVSHR